MSKLLAPSPPAWLEAVLGDFDAFLVDHAACERKASATAMSLVAHYSDRPELVEHMIELAREELEHFHAVARLLHGRGLRLGRDSKDPYVGALRDAMRHGAEHYFMDRLLVGAVVEMRGCERFGLIADALPADELGAFYREITRSEARHGGLFVRLARMYCSRDEVDERLVAWLELEAQVVQGLPIRAALH